MSEKPTRRPWLSDGERVLYATFLPWRWRALSLVPVPLLVAGAVLMFETEGVLNTIGIALCLLYAVAAIGLARWIRRRFAEPS